MKIVKHEFMWLILVPTLYLYFFFFTFVNNLFLNNIFPVCMWIQDLTKTNFGQIWNYILVFFFQRAFTPQIVHEILGVKNWFLFMTNVLILLGSNLAVYGRCFILQFHTHIGHHYEILKLNKCVLFFIYFINLPISI